MEVVEISKYDFVQQLGELLALTRSGVVSCEYIQNEVKEEYAQIHFENGYFKNVCISGDSHLGIMDDVTKSLF